MFFFLQYKCGFLIKTLIYLHCSLFAGNLPKQPQPFNCLSIFLIYKRTVTSGRPYLPHYFFFAKAYYLITLLISSGFM